MDIKIDSHKLHLHPEAVTDWIRGERVYPITAEVGLCSICNHRCIFCALDYLEYTSEFIDTDTLLKALYDMKQLGLKSVVFAGEGEPMLHKYIVDIVKSTKAMGIDIGISTNGAAFTDEKIEQILPYLTWVRFSVGGATEPVYKRVHKCPDGHFEKAVLAIQGCCLYKKQRRLKATIGVQTILLPQNLYEIVPMARSLKNIGVDYFTIKPFSKHPQSKCNFEIDYTKMLQLEEAVKQHETDIFKVHFRSHCMAKKNELRQYNKCNGIDFMAHMSAKAEIYPCIAYLGLEDYCYGSLYDEPFKNIWTGSRKGKVIRKINEDMAKCREMCRLDEINRYLERVEHKKDHDNFI